MENTIILNGKDLTIDAIKKIAYENWKVEIAPESREYIVAGRNKIFELVDSDVPVYGFNTGVGWNKDKKVMKDFFNKYNTNLIYSHSLGVEPNCTREEGRAILVNRLNTFLVGCTGVAVEIVDMYKTLLNEDIIPVIPSRGSVGEADITNLSHIGLAIIGEGEVYFRNEIRNSGEVFKELGIEKINLGPKDGLAIVSSNALSAGLYSLVLSDIEKLIELSDIVYAMSLEALNGNTSPLDPDLYELRNFKGQKESLKNVTSLLEGSAVYYQDWKKPVQDPLSFRGTVQLNGALRDAYTYASELFRIQLNSAEDNPCLILEKNKLISCSNYEPISWILGAENLGIALSHISKNSCFRIIKLANPDFTKLPRFLSMRDNILGYATIQKVFTSLDAEVRHLSNPATADYYSLAGEIEDHANNTVYVINKLKKIVDNIFYIYGIELMHAVQAIDLRTDWTLGKGSRKVYEKIREILPFYDEDRPIFKDIKIMYNFIKSTDLISMLCEEGIWKE
ncbi:MAG: aromatic amino acid ammonia-lyase [Fusobacterium gastrosuis]|uniref:HAL/PAL/TAL family ammonia-lyase n=1 Tax=Fusobacterium gastrosuis TaxID=1755100 RepID=UPI002A844794|nr:aromatic amino acid ammonia-lyase [Fusobacterium gastrosuis]